MNRAPCVLFEMPKCITELKEIVPPFLSVLMLLDNVSMKITPTTVCTGIYVVFLI